MMTSLPHFQVMSYKSGIGWSRPGTRTKRHQILTWNPTLVSRFLVLFTTNSIYPFLGTSTIELCLKIAKEEAALAETGADQPYDMTPARLIQNGLDLEEQQ